MNTFINTLGSPLDIEVVERKGIGHPDSLADIIAEDFSNKYSLYCLEQFGVVLNYWFDKVTISGGVCDLGFGRCDVLKPITIYLFGRVTTKFANHEIPFEDMFKESCLSVFRQIFGDTYPKESINFFFDVNSALGADHEKTYYSPNSVDSLKTFENFTANDTVVCHGYAPYTKTETICIAIENFLNSDSFKNKYRATGWDIKVLIIRESNSYRITVCVPFIATKTKSHEFYLNSKNEIKKEISEFLQTGDFFSSNDSYEIYLNTKDRDNLAYLVAYGSAADKGDYGAVGRGNRYSGVISVNRGTNVEAVNGKNSRNHSGKLYTVLSHSLASFVYNKTGEPCQVIITTDNGRPLSDPTMVVVHFDNKGFNLNQGDDLIIKKHIKMVFDEIEKLSSLIISRNPVTDFKNIFIYA